MDLLKIELFSDNLLQIRPSYLKPLNRYFILNQNLYFKQEMYVFTMDETLETSLFLYKINYITLFNLIWQKAMSSIFRSFKSKKIQIVIKVSSFVGNPVSSLIYIPVSSILCNPISSLIYNPLSSIICNPVSSLIYNLVSSLIYNPLSSIIYNPVSSLICNPVSSLICNPVSSLIWNLVFSLI